VQELIKSSEYRNMELQKSKAELFAIAHELTQTWIVITSTI
jgi:hypothetical protein